MTISVFPIVAGVDDGFEVLGSWNGGDSPRWGNGFGFNTQGGVSFQNVTIPPGSTINLAQLDYSIFNTSVIASETAYLAGQNSGNPPAISNTNLPSAWSMTVPRVLGIVHLNNLPVTLDVTTIVAHLITLGSWASGNRMNFAWIPDFFFAILHETRVTPITETLTVNYTPPGGGGAIDGSVTVTFTADSFLTGTGILQGGVSSAVDTSGVLTGAGQLVGVTSLTTALTAILSGISIAQLSKYSRQTELATRLIKEKGDTLEVHRYTDPGPGAYDPLTDTPLPVVVLPNDSFTAHGVLLPLTRSQIKDVFANDPTALVSQKARLLLSTENLKFAIKPGHRLVFDSSITPSQEWWSIDSLTRLSPDLAGAPILYSLLLTRHAANSSYLPAANDVFTDSINLAQRLITEKGRVATIRKFDWQDGVYDPDTDSPDPVTGAEFLAPIVILPLSKEMDIAYPNTGAVDTERALALLSGADAAFIPMPGNRVMTGDSIANDWWTIQFILPLEPNRDKILYKLILTRGGGIYAPSIVENFMLLEDGAAILLEEVAGGILLE